MRALLVLDTHPFWPKPVVRAIREATTLSRSGWEVAFVSWMRSPGPSAPVDQAYPVRFVYAPVPALGSSLLGRGLAYNRVTRTLLGAIIEARPDLIIAHDLLVLRAAVAAKRVLRVPLLYDCHENWPVLVAENSRIESILTAMQERRLTRWVDHLLIPCEPVARRFRAWRVPTSVVINSRPAADVVLADRNDSRRRLGYSAEDFVLGFAGALAEGRGLEILLEAMVALPAGFKAVIVGGPDAYAERLRRQVDARGLSSRVRLEPYQSYGELAPVYAAMDLGLILLDRRPNHITALPNKLFDYMAHGVPVLVPDYPAMKEIAQEGPCGWTVPDVTPMAVADAIKTARASGETKVRGAKGREAFLGKYSWDHQEATFLSIVSDLMSPRRT